MQVKTLRGEITQENGTAPLPGAVWYTAKTVGSSLVFSLPPGSLAGQNWLTADFLLAGNTLAVFELVLQEGETGPAFGYSFGLLNQCQARLRLPLEAINLNRWMYPREGALLKPRTTGERVSLADVDRLVLTVIRKGPLPTRWCMTTFQSSQTEPEFLDNPILPKGPLLDALGQSTLHYWPGKSRDQAEVIERLKSQLAAAPQHQWPENFSRWGGWKEKRFDATGFFRTQQTEERWWLVDPDGYAFWSTGLDCVRVDTDANIGGLESALAWLPEPNGPFAAAFEDHGPDRIFNFLTANLIRAFGENAWYTKWAEISLGEIRRSGFNTVANWSDWRIASQAGIPYVRPLEPEYEQLPMVYRDFPDVFHPDFEDTAASFAKPLAETADDPAFIGYFLMNEPTWGFSPETPAAGMLFNNPACHSREKLAHFLRQSYNSDAGLSAAWSMDVTLGKVAEGEWNLRLTPSAEADLAAFSSIMVDRFFGMLSRACKQVDPHHLNLGIRYYTVPPSWALEGMKYFDVFSMNCYRERLPAAEMASISQILHQPVMVGEWHFGALDAGLPASGIGAVANQTDRGRAYRAYVEDAAVKPWCVGVHYFILYDQSALGRFDGENYNIGFLDVCNRPYEQLVEAARLSHERLYDLTAGWLTPYQDAPDYLPLLFM